MKSKKVVAKRGALLIWSVPSKLKAKFKAACAAKKTTMKEVIIKAMRDFCARH